MTIIKFVFILLYACCNIFCVSAQPQVEKSIRLFIDINSPVDSVWNRWTSPDNIRKFFAPASEVEFKALGKFNIFFTPNKAQGLKGAEDNFFLAIQEKQMLSFTWDAPPNWPEIRKQRTSVVVRFIKTTDTTTQVTLTQSGWGTGNDWDEVYDYFVSAWGGAVLPFLKYSLEIAPINWSDFPNKLPKGVHPAQRF